MVLSPVIRCADQVRSSMAALVPRPVAGAADRLLEAAGGLRGGDGDGPLRHPADELVWHRAEVLGSRTYYGVGGNGPPVVFLHGWAMGDHAYKRAVRRLTSRGCRVYVPALPGFAGTADLPSDRMSIDGYAEWVDRFMDAVGIDDPVMLIGHSFGGGVAIKVAHREPQRVRYLVLLNSVGGVRTSGALSERMPWEWALNFVREFLPFPQGFEIVQAMRRDLVANLTRNPLNLLRVADVARTADLTTELADLRTWKLPVLALTSDGDGVIPHSAFEALCEAVGTEGHIVAGPHSWLLSNPDALGEVLANVVEAQVVEHRSAGAAGRVEQVAERLAATTVPADTARALLDEANPLWLMSDDPEVLAGDLALSHPPLEHDEVRAVARFIRGFTGVRLSVVAADRPGLLADAAAVLAANGLQIQSASATTWGDAGLALHAFTVEPTVPFGDEGWERLGNDLRDMVRSGPAPVPQVTLVGRATVRTNGSGDDRTMVRIVARDRPGLLWLVCRWFADEGLSIESLHAATDRGVARDTFVVLGSCDAEALADHLSEPAHRLSAAG